MIPSFCHWNPPKNHHFTIQPYVKSWKPPYFTPQKKSVKKSNMTVYIHMYMYTYPYFTRKNICAICDHRESISSKSPPLRRAPHSSRSAAALRRADRSVASADPSWRPRGRRLCRRPPAGRWPGPLRRFRSSWLFLRDFFGWDQVESFGI